jgi:intracellular septation protein A
MRANTGLSIFGLALQSGPRFARDILGPLLSFYASWKLVGLDAGVAAATGFAVGAFAWERGQARSGLSAAIGLGVALVQAIAGLASARTIWYFAPPLIINGACGVAFLASVVIGQPLAAVFAADTYAFTPQVMASATFRDVCSRISLVWATYLLLCSAARLVVLLRSSVNVYVTVNFVTGFPLAAGIMLWSMWYGARSLPPSPAPRGSDVAARM